MSQPYEPPRPRVNPAEEETRRDAAAALAARMELGPDYTEQVAAGLADRVEQLAAFRTAELRHVAQVGSHEQAMERTAQKQRFVLGIVSLGAGIPITAIAATNVEPGLIGVAVSWLGIVGVNLANAWGSRRRR